MAKIDMHKKVKQRYGSRLADGRAHAEMHEAFSRRAFLRNTGLVGMGSLLTLNGKALTEMMPNALTEGLANSDSDRVLVLIRLDGGNDGLNTVILRDNDEYYNIRPTLAIGENDLWGLSDDIGMPNFMQDLQPLWEDGRMKVIHNVGYPSPNYSHFRSSDIWASASESDEIVDTGWIGRAMEAQYSSFLETPPSVPPAIQIGIENNLIFTGKEATMALSISNPTEFYRIAQQGQLYETENLNTCPAEAELKFARQTANNAFRYSTTIQEAYSKGTTKVNYPDNFLAEQLAIVSRLIKGDLGTRVYMVSIGGFDTHSDQADSHPLLMERLSSAVSAFMADLDEDNLSEKVLGMTFSEFGRTIFENGSFGTDHGTGSPVLLFGGENLGNGFIGTPPDLENPGQYGDPDFDVDFRSVYAMVLGDWLGMDDRYVEHILGDQDKLNGVVPAGDFPSGLNAQDALLAYRTGVDGTVELKYALSKAGNTKLSLLKMDGNPYREFVDTYLEKGSYTYRINKAESQVATGSYFIELKTNGRIYRRHVLVK